jgi:uncharacterized repeat protein (TIGR01451 family)
VTVDADAHYTVTENSHSGYGVTYSSGCDGTMSENGDATCTVTNNDNSPTQGFLTVRKHVVNDNGGTAVDSVWTLKANDTVMSNGTATLLNPASYTISETGGPSGYQQTSIKCAIDGGSDVDAASVNIEAGHSYVCTITNDDISATLTIVKNTNGGNGTFTFGVTGQDDTSITTEEGSGSKTLTLDPGGYDVTEKNILAGWTLQNSHPSCVYDNESIGNVIQNGEHVVLDLGDSVTCTFTNTATGADLAIQKSIDDATPDNGQTITYAITVTNNGPADASDVVVTDILPAGVSYVSDNSTTTETTYATSTGHWTIGTLANGITKELHIVAQVTAEGGQSVSNTATASSDNADTNTDNNSESVSFTVGTPAPTPTPTPSPTPTPAPPGGNGPPVGGGGGGNGPITGSFGGPSGQVLGASSSTLPELPAGCKALLKTFMRQNRAKNDSNDVKKLQQFLNDNLSSNLPLTGFFGPLTNKAVRNFQQSHSDQVLTPWGLNEPTGFVYLTTQRWINLMYCKSLSIPIPTLVPFSGE